MPLFCKQCNDRRFPIVQNEDKKTLWLCETCENFVDPDDVIVRELTESEKNETKAKLEEFEKSTANISTEKMSRRKGVN